MHQPGLPMSHVQIEALRSMRHFQACEEIQLEVWGKLAVSAELLKVTQQHGGAVLGAVCSGQVCGFVYAFPARYRGHWVHWSHLMAVRSEARDRGLGFRMKRLHRRLALAQGIRSICWTFDPLQSRNAKLNISRLGGEVDEYIPDCYGKFPSLIEKGLPSDRFVVNWRIGTARVLKRLRARRVPRSPLLLPHINETVTNDDGLLENRQVNHSLLLPRVLVEIPACPERMREDAPRLALRWRMETRGIFERYLRRRYRVADFVREHGRCFYVLQRPSRNGWRASPAQ